MVTVFLSVPGRSYKARGVHCFFGRLHYHGNYYSDPCPVSQELWYRVLFSYDLPALTPAVSCWFVKLDTIYPPPAFSVYRSLYQSVHLIVHRHTGLPFLFVWLFVVILAYIFMWKSSFVCFSLFLFIKENFTALSLTGQKENPGGMVWGKGIW